MSAPICERVTIDHDFNWVASFYFARRLDKSLLKQLENELKEAVNGVFQKHHDGLNGQARNPAGLPDSSGDLASAGGIAGVDITDHRRQVGTPHDGSALTGNHETDGAA